MDVLDARQSPIWWLVVTCLETGRCMRRCPRPKSSRLYLKLGPWYSTSFRVSFFRASLLVRGQSASMALGAIQSTAVLSHCSLQRRRMLYFTAPEKIDLMRNHSLALTSRQSCLCSDRKGHTRSNMRWYRRQAASNCEHITSKDGRTCNATGADADSPMR